MSSDVSQTDNIVVTGVGLASALGRSAQQTWQSVLAGRGSAGPMPALESTLPDGTSGYEALDLPPDFFPDAPREVRYLKWVLAEALRQANLDGKSLPYPPHRCGIIIGTTLHGMRGGGQFLRTGDLRNLHSFLAGSTLDQSAGDLPFTADAMTTCSACSSSLGSIALAVTLLESGQLDLVISGGYDTVSEYAYAGFNSLRLISPGSLRPFARDRQGMKLGEGYGVVVLERASDAKRRGITALARVLGYGESADAHHLTQPHPQGEGAAAAMTAALQRAGLRPEQIDLVAAHATGTPDNDAGEYAALARVFGEGLSRVPVVGFKSHVGHTLGGAGAVELILSVMALREQVIPACRNVTPTEIEVPNLNLVTDAPRPSPIHVTLNTSLGFGGANTCVILGRQDEIAAPAIHVRSGRERDVMISGVGVVLPGAVGAEAFLQQLKSGRAAETGDINESDYVHLLNARRVRRMSEYVKLTLGATTLACQDARVGDAANGGGDFAQSCSAILGTAHGGSVYCLSYYRQIVNEGMAAANPMLFAEGVPNAAAAHLSLMLSLKGACQTVIGSRTAGLDALRLAALRITSGQWDRAIVSAAEENVAEVNQAYGKCGLHAEPDGAAAVGAFAGGGGFRAGAGAVTLVLESRESLARRHGRARGQVVMTSAARYCGSNPVSAIGHVVSGLGDPPFVIASANNTWVDRAEAAAIGRDSPGAVLSTIYGHIRETFSAAPLAAIAAVLLTGKMPPLRTPGGDALHDLHRVRAATGGERVTSFGVLCTGYTRTVAGASIRIIDDE